MLDIVENHLRLVDERTDSGIDTAVALQFLLQTLAALDVATRGFIDGTRRYEQQRARAEDLADRDEFRTALVNSLQEGFFVADRNGAVIEINDAFADITGYGPDGLPYTWPHPWMADDDGSDAATGPAARARARWRRRRRSGTATATSCGWRRASTRSRRRTPTRTRVRRNHSRHHRRAGRGRTGTCGRCASPRPSAWPRDVDEVLSITLDECRTALDVAASRRRLVADGRA